MIDTHCHIDLYKQPLEVAAACETQKIRTVAVTHLPSHYQMAKQHLRRFQYVRPALGMHPLSVKDHSAEMALFRRAVKEADLVGEIGLDFSPACLSSKAAQEESFAGVLDSLRGRQRFLTLHSRRAEDSVLSHLRTYEIEKAVFHWFSGTRSQLIRIMDAGHYVSVNAAMIGSEKWTDLIRLVPKDRVLTESDGPFAKFGGKPAVPTCVANVLQWLAEQWSELPADVETRVERNFDLLFGDMFRTT